MRKTLTTLICATVAVTGLMQAEAAKKNDPDKRDVQKLMEELGDPHYQDRMKVYSVCSLEFEGADGEDDYYHIYSGTLKKGGYHLIVYNNVPEYLGFYLVDFEPVDYEEGAVLLDSGDGSTYFPFPIPASGPADTVRVDGIPTKFVKNPRLEEKKEGPIVAGGGIPAVPDKETSASGEVIDYRDWNITIKGRTITVNALFVKVEKGQVTLKSSKNGRETTIPGSAFSDEDKEYIRRITAK
ncbi:hypothetical protein [Pontiella agarivorans]|uniref:SLA1 homology domain-containing protein n=1 Tax=Pontiella agarivorans TaxID=3038953 RepID=A0ABU5MT61_9BACT|nr:hypothetical protein [Pontiella agarivorans]MDZ8117385.1 hypothetical protein [Pontiella agarivorans]